MPVNVPDLQTIEAADLEGTDWLLVSRRDATSRDLKNKGVVYGEWFIPFADFVEAVAAALITSDGFGDVVDAVVLELDNYVEPTWTTV
jgi:hypothetical protein